MNKMKTIVRQISKKQDKLLPKGYYPSHGIDGDVSRVLYNTENQTQKGMKYQIILYKLRKV